MNKTDKLKDLMTFNADLDSEEIENRFQQIAKMLFANFAINKGEDIYLFKEIEFYFYNNNHRDIISHPRNSEALCWYINDFGGIDINLSSIIKTENHVDNKGKITTKYSLDEKAFFGGILIRQLINTADGNILTGPINCVDIFRSHRALGVDREFPTLVEHDNGIVALKQKSRYNLLPAKQTTKNKVDNILRLYHRHPDKSELYEAFNVFKDKPYAYERFDDLMHDELTNVLYLSPWLKDNKDGNPDFYNRLKALLNQIGIRYKELNNTADYWVRDYMPFQQSKHQFLKYRYSPDYLRETGNEKYITNVDKVLRGMDLNCRKTDLIIDGGNIVACGPYIVMTDKVFTENKRDIGDTDFKKELESVFGQPVIIIPWTMHGDFNKEDTDKYGHADGFIKWCGGNRILMGNHGDSYPDEANTIRKILESYGFEETEMRFNYKVSHSSPEFNWAYINFLQVGKNIIMPKFDIEEDQIAYIYVKEAFPSCNISQIEMAKIAMHGGALHCISWNIYAHE